MCTRPARRSAGVTLVELIVFIVIVGVAMAALFAAFGTMTRASADPEVRKQLLAIAESLMEEIAQKPFTFCDPDDPAAATAASPAACATAEAIGPEGGETRYDPPGPRFDNVSDYHGFAMAAGIQDLANNTIAGLGAYSVDPIAITLAGTALGLAVDADALRISITVRGPGGAAITLEGYRTRYAPRVLP